MIIKVQSSPIRKAQDRPAIEGGMACDLEPMKPEARHLITIFNK